MTSNRQRAFDIALGWSDPSRAASIVGALCDEGLIPDDTVNVIDAPNPQRPYIIRIPDVTRVCVVTEKERRVLDQYDAYSNGVDIAVQDDGRTVKVLPRDTTEGQ